VIDIKDIRRCGKVMTVITAIEGKKNMALQFLGR